MDTELVTKTAPETPTTAFIRVLKSTLTYALPDMRACLTSSCGTELSDLMATMQHYCELSEHPWTLRLLDIWRQRLEKAIPDYDWTTQTFPKEVTGKELAAIIEQVTQEFVRWAEHDPRRDWRVAAAKRSGGVHQSLADSLGVAGFFVKKTAADSDGSTSPRYTPCDDASPPSSSVKSSSSNLFDSLL